jgi:hypothetical protein
MRKATPMIVKIRRPADMNLTITKYITAAATTGIREEIVTEMAKAGGIVAPKSAATRR